MTGEDPRVTRARGYATHGALIGHPAPVIAGIVAAYEELKTNAARVLVPELADLANQRAAEQAEADTEAAQLQDQIQQLQAATDRVRLIHQPIDAVHERTGEHHKLCAGCSTARDQWIKWPCRTIDALDQAKEKTS